MTDKRNQYKNSNLKSSFDLHKLRIIEEYTKKCFTNIDDGKKVLYSSDAFNPNDLHDLPDFFPDIKKRLPKTKIYKKYKLKTKSMYSDLADAEVPISHQIVLKNRCCIL